MKLAAKITSKKQIFLCWMVLGRWEWECFPNLKHIISFESKSLERKKKDLTKNKHQVQLQFTYILKK